MNHSMTNCCAKASRLKVLDANCKKTKITTTIKMTVGTKAPIQKARGRKIERWNTIGSHFCS